MNILEKILGNYSQKQLKSYTYILEKVNQMEKKFLGLKSEDFLKYTEQWRQEVKEGKKLEELIPESFALVRYAAQITLQERHFDVQVLGGIALHQGNIAEMKTGEGKTLTSTLAVYLNSLLGRGVHVVTVNDYLAQRDSEWMGRVYACLGLEVGLITNNMPNQERSNAYLADVTYGTNNEFGFDYLRDNIKYNYKEKVQREYYFAIIDEIDSILIDEARTPLIISGASEQSIDKYVAINDKIGGLKRAWRKKDQSTAENIARNNNIGLEAVASFLEEKEDNDLVIQGEYTLDEKTRNIQLTEQGLNIMESRLSDIMTTSSLYDFQSIDTLHLVNQALRAYYVFKNDIDYLVKDQQVKIVDEFTGRVLDGRRFGDGLHQALEAKEGVPIENENQTLASITFQNYFRRYEKLSGMTGTAETEKEEFQKIYGLGVVVIPTHKKLIRKDNEDAIYRTEKIKFDAIIDKIEKLYQAKQPVLVGTDSIATSEKISQLLQKKRLPYNVLNAKHHAQEAEIIANAGVPGAITISTNMAGRGTDIKIGETIKAKGLFVLGTCRHEARRIDNQLIGRSGRQGDPGESQFILSLDDDLLRIFGGEKIANLMARLNIEEKEEIKHSLISKSIWNAQKKIESRNFSIRKHLLEYDNIMDQQRRVFYQLRENILNGEITLGTVSVELLENILDKYNDKNLEEPALRSLQDELEQIFTQEFVFASDNMEEIRKVATAALDTMYVQKKESLKQYNSFIESQILINVADTLWKNHLLELDGLKEGIGLRGYGQKNPLDEYKKEAFQLFEIFLEKINQSAVYRYFQVEIQDDTAVPVAEKPQKEPLVLHRGITAETKKKLNIPARKSAAIGRNELCPCGSGKKYKHCCLKKYVQQSFQQKSIL